MYRLKELSCNFGVLAAMCCVLALAASGCGKKEWPQASAPDERFFFVEVNGGMEGDCLVVRAELGGKVANLAAVTLELAAPDDCLTCPFRPIERTTLHRAEAPEAFDAGSFVLDYCGVAPGSSLRWRLVGDNKAAGLPPVVSEETVSE